MQLTPTKNVTFIVLIREEICGIRIFPGGAIHQNLLKTAALQNITINKNLHAKHANKNMKSKAINAKTSNKNDKILQLLLSLTFIVITVLSLLCQTVGKHAHRSDIF